MNAEPIPMSSPDITNVEREAVAAVLRTPNLSMGSEIEAMESGIREYLGCKHAIAVNSGTAGLHLCVRAAGIGAGDLVLTTPFSFVASTNVLLFERAVPIFLDVDPVTGNLDPSLVQQAAWDLSQGGSPAAEWLPRKFPDSLAVLKAILPVDVFGQPADMDAILPTAQEFGLKVIEDSCEALGAEYKGRKAGLLGDYGVFGFYPNKQITTGEGGIIVTEDDQDAALMRALRNQGRAPGDTWLQHTHLGYNYRLDEMSAALGRVQLSRLDEMIAKRAAVAAMYLEQLDALSEVECLSISPNTTRQSWFVFVVRFAAHIDRDHIAMELIKNGIPARPYFTPIHLQPYMVERFDYKPGDFPVTEDLGRRSLALPFSSMMSGNQVERVCATLSSILAE
ncbi:MAG: polysaccharide biosynthesis protein [Chloroflexi bacterium RBG_16_54_18]|nr:MAG: polysaccharide biosynthesis protein [Chloroflexi bacterium RBG_16_54_18]